MGLFSITTYKATCYCDNCDSIQKINIKRGTPILEALKNTACPNCDVKKLRTLKKVEEIFFGNDKEEYEPVTNEELEAIINPRKG